MPAWRQQARTKSARMGPAYGRQAPKNEEETRKGSAMKKRRKIVVESGGERGRVYRQAGRGCGVAEPAGEAGLRDEGVLQDDRYDPAGTQDVFCLGFASTNPKNP